MNEQKFQKPSVEEWLHLAEVVIDRLTECIHIYKKPPHSDVFMSDGDRQKKSSSTVGLLQRVHALIDNSEMPSDSVPDAHAHDERLINGLTMLFGEMLKALPALSNDMQKLLKSPWLKNFPNMTAERLFYGEDDESEGIGSGYPEQGRLPAVLAALLEREDMGDDRHPREALLRHGEPRRHDMEARQRWTEQNSRFLRTAGRVE